MSNEELEDLRRLPMDRSRHRLASALVDRFAAGESVSSLARDYDLPPHVVEVIIAAYREGQESVRGTP